MELAETKLQLVSSAIVNSPRNLEFHYGHFVRSCLTFMFGALWSFAVDGCPGKPIVRGAFRKIAQGFRGGSR